MPNPAMMGMPQNGGNKFNNPFQLISQFNNFKRTFQGDPKQRVEELLSSGQMSQEQFNQLSQMANSFRGIFK